MESSFQWYLPECIVYVRFPVITGYDFLQRVNDDILPHLEATPHLIHIIGDARLVEQGPNNIFKIRQVSPVFDHRMVGWSVLVSENPVFRFMGSVVPQIITRQRTRAYATMDEAIDFLRTREPEADWSQADDSLLEP